MSIVKLSEYGLNLSGRSHGMRVFDIINNKFEAPFVLDFEGVFSIGSSFADEVVAKLAEINSGSIEVLNTTMVINKCLKDVSKDKKFELITKS